MSISRRRLSTGFTRRLKTEKSDTSSLPNALKNNSAIASSALNKLRLLSICALVSLLSSFVLPHALLAQNEVSDPGAVVALEEDEIFVVRAKLGPYGPEERARGVLKKLKGLLKEPDFKPESIVAVESDGETDILAGDTVITSVTDIDAKVAATAREDLAQQYVNRLKAVLARHKAKQSIEGAIKDASVENFSRSLMQLLFEPTTLKIITALIGAVAISTLVAFVRRSVGRYVTDSSKRYASKKIIDFVGGFVGLIFVTVVFRDALGNLAVIVGAVTAGIAFALKEVIVSIAGWIAVTFGDFYHVGDRIQLGGIKGDVIDIGFGRTTLMELGEWVNGDLYTGRIVRVSNGFVFSQPFFNYSGDFPFLWDECTVPVKYGSDHKLARQILEKVADQVSAEFIEQAEAHWRQIAKKYLVEDARTSPMVTIVLNDNWMEFTVRYVVNYRRRRLAKDQLFTLLLEELEQTEGRVQLASATFQLVETPVFDVRIKQPAAK